MVRQEGGWVEVLMRGCKRVVRACNGVQWRTRRWCEMRECVCVCVIEGVCVAVLLAWFHDV